MTTSYMVLLDPLRATMSPGGVLVSMPSVKLRKMNALALCLINQIDQPFDAATEPIQLPDDERIGFTQVRRGLFKPPIFQEPQFGKKAANCRGELSQVRVLRAFCPLNPNSPRVDTYCKSAGFTPSVVRIHSCPCALQTQGLYSSSGNFLPARSRGMTHQGLPRAPHSPGTSRVTTLWLPKVFSLSGSIYDARVMAIPSRRKSATISSAVSPSTMMPLTSDSGAMT